MLRIELAFYLGCLNLRERLDEKGEPACFPVPLAAGQLALAAEGLYDVCLTLHLEDRAVGNEVNADGKSLVMITGANQGGKSTLLRSLGLAHLMMQSGMFTVFFVSHMYDLAYGFHAQGLDTALFLRAERQPDGRRTFKLVEREPLPTSYGEDSYRRIFGTGEAAAAAVADTSR